MDFKPFKIGKYLLLERLAVGGMAEVYRANARGAGGFEKQLAIKRILPNYASNEEFRRMFEYEARLSSLLGHANIVQIYDFEKAGNDYLLAMEYVNGKNLRQFVNKARKVAIPIPIEFSVFVVNEVAKGLDYAHNKKDEVSGRALNVIHRDMSPQNIMLSYDGAVKIVDFGIAKAKDRVDETRSGVIKGKFSYMSPEQANGESVDHRSDIFSTGIILYELLTGRRLFAAENDLATLKMIQECVFKRPSQVNPKITLDLERILLKILTKDTKLRYQNAGLLNQHLQEFLNKNFSAYSARDVSALLNKVFAAEIVEEKKRFEILRQQSIPFSQGIQTDSKKNEDDELGAIEDILEGTATKSEQRQTTGITQSTAIKRLEKSAKEDGGASIRLEGEKTQQAHRTGQKLETPKFKAPQRPEKPAEEPLSQSTSISTEAATNDKSQAASTTTEQTHQHTKGTNQGTFTPTPIASHRSMATEPKTQATQQATRAMDTTTEQTSEKSEESEFVQQPERYDSPTAPSHTAQTASHTEQESSGVEYAASPYSDDSVGPKADSDANPLSRMLEHDFRTSRRRVEQRRTGKLVPFGSVVALAALTWYLYGFLNSEKAQFFIEMLSPRQITQVPEPVQAPSSDEAVKQKGAPGAPTECVMHIDSDPRGALVFIDGKERGVTSTEVVLPCGTAFDLNLTLKGFEGAADNLVARQKNGAYFRKLAKIPMGYLEIEPRRNMQLYIDNEFVQELDASAQTVLEVRAKVVHTIQLKNEVFGIDIVRKVIVEEGKKEKLVIEETPTRNSLPGRKR